MDRRLPEVDRFQAREPLVFDQGRKRTKKHDDAAREPHCEEQAQSDTEISVKRGKKVAPVVHRLSLV